MPLSKIPKPPRFEVDNIYFSLQLIKAHIPIKFKCRFLVEIKTCSTTSSLKTLGKSKDQYREKASLITFSSQQTFVFNHYMVYDIQLSRYKKTQIQLLVSLISDSRGDQVKLVGRVRVDLNEFMIDNRGQVMRREQELENCSVKKPQVAKLMYELRLVKEEKMNIAENPSREAIYAEIDRGVFPDALQYNQFGKQVFGKDFSIINMSKLNKSLNEGSSNIRINDSLSKLNGSKVQLQAEKINKTEKIVIEKGSTKGILNFSLKDVKEKAQGGKTGENVSLQSSSQNVNSLGQQKQQTVKLTKITPSKYSLQNPPKQLTLISQLPNTQPSPQQQSLQTPIPQATTQPKKLSPIKHPLQQSPRHKSKITQPVSQQMTQIQPQSQPKRNYLTQSMFQQQQLVIQSLQQQLQQANQMIEQYKLQMQLMKEQTQRLQNEKSMHASELQTSRARNLSGSMGILLPTVNNNNNQQYNLQTQSLKHQIQLCQQQLNQYKKVFTQKQQIIEQKDHVINNLTQEIQLAAHEMDLRLAQKDSLYNELNQQYMMVKEDNAYMKGQMEKMVKEIEQKEYAKGMYESMISQLKTQIDLLNKTLNQTPLASLTSELQNKNHLISQLQHQIQLQKTTTAQLQLKLANFQSTITNLNKSLQQLKLKLDKSQQSSKKHQQLKHLAEQQLSKAVDKAKLIQKQKYQLTQHIAQINLNAKNIDKLVDEKVSTYKNQYDQLVMTYEQSQNKIAELKFALQSYQSTLSIEQSKSQSHINELTKNLQNFNKKQHLLRQSLDLLSNESHKIRNFVQQKQSQLKEYKQLIKLQQEQLNQKTDKLTYLQRKLRMNQNTINDLKLQLKVVQTMNSQPREGRELKDGQEQNETRLYILNEVNTQLTQKQKYLTQLLQQKQQSLHELKKLKHTIDPLKRQLSTLQTQLSNSQQKHLELKQQLKVLNKLNAQQRTRTDQQSQQLEHAYKQYSKLQEQLSLLEDEKGLVVGQWQEREQEVVNLQAVVSKIKDTQKTLERQLTLKDTQINKIKSLLTQSQKLNQQLTKRLPSLQTSTLSQHHNKKQQLLIESRTLLNQQHQPLSSIRSPVKDIYTSPKCARTKQQQQIYRLTEELQGYKQREESYMCNVLDLQEQLQQVKKERLSSSINEQRQSIRKSQPLAAYDSKYLKQACDQLEKLIETRLKNRDAENLIQIIVSNSQLLGGSQSRATTQEGTLFARQKNSLTEKSRILSREVQKIKALIFKKPDIPYKNKTEIIQFLKPCENITNDLIKIAESFAKDNEDEQLSEN